ncbi:hypothetical protein G4G93_32310 [Methylobacterium sp. DB0501]|jgi:hypothetical protein|uniref:hypothetical protein n=1 Tax=Methylobacterium sp. DB0501 TaxID=2709665 RepID=UPI0013EACF44|nr:hypothetical protein [Methylobacterium sp. DB0501]NGM38526.1 hypothetical protein [Methylobacterium sp. DB0501]
MAAMSPSSPAANVAKAGSLQARACLIQAPMSAALSSPWLLILWQGLAIERAVSKFLSMFARGLKNKPSPLRPRPQIQIGKRLRMSMIEAEHDGY